MKESVVRRKRRTRGKLRQDGYRLSIYRSNRFLFAQIIDQKTGKTIFGLAEKALVTDKGKTKTERAKIFGAKFAKEALSRKVNKVIFDRGSYHYHGRIKAFADAAREGGLQF